MSRWRHPCAEVNALLGLGAGAGQLNVYAARCDAAMALNACQPTVTELAVSDWPVVGLAIDASAERSNRATPRCRLARQAPAAEPGNDHGSTPSKRETTPKRGIPRYYRALRKRLFAGSFAFSWSQRAES